jgi:beta-lactamase class A
MNALILAAILTLPPQVSDATIGVTAIDVESGQRLSSRNLERFPMGSVYKFPIALTVLRLVDHGILGLDRQVAIEPREFSPGHSPLRDEANGRAVTFTIRELLRYMVSLSDNTASDKLLELCGGARAVTTRLAELGASSVRVDRSERQMAADIRKPGGVEVYARDARDTSTPDAMADLLVTFWQRRDGLSRESHDLLVHWMTETPTGPRRIKSAVPGWTLAHKTGTMPGTVNDVGILTSADGKRHIVLAIFTKGSKRDVTRDQEGDIAAITRKVLDCLAGFMEAEHCAQGATVERDDASSLGLP